MKRAVIEGVYELPPDYQPYAIPGMWPRRYWDIIEYEDEEDLAAYLAGQQTFEQPRERVEPFYFGQQARDERRRPAGHQCERCGRDIKPQYKFCYRCNNYLKVKERIA